jgi:hypothetical protein
MRPGTQLHHQISQEHQRMGARSGWPVTSSYSSIPSGWGRRDAATLPG